MECPKRSIFWQSFLFILMGLEAGAAIPRPPVAMRTATRTPVTTPRVMPAKTKIMSILDRARIAMEESYGFEDAYETTETIYDSYPPTTVSRSRSYSGTHHYEPEYEQEYYGESSSSYEASQRWKPYKSASSSTSRHTETARYRTSPYSRPSK